VWEKVEVSWAKALACVAGISLSMKVREFTGSVPYTWNKATLDLAYKSLARKQLKLRMLFSFTKGVTCMSKEI
jgi:hypothetical protein